MVSAALIIDVGYVLLPWRQWECSALPAPIHARLRGWAEQNHSPNLKCMLIKSYIEDSGPDRTIFNDCTNN